MAPKWRRTVGDGVSRALSDFRSGWLQALSRKGSLDRTPLDSIPNEEGHQRRASALVNTHDRIFGPRRALASDAQVCPHLFALRG